MPAFSLDRHPQSHRRILGKVSIKDFIFSRAPQEGWEPAEAILAEGFHLLCEAPRKLSSLPLSSQTLSFEALLFLRTFIFIKGAWRLRR
jgi:hypothetical protein